MYLHVLTDRAIGWFDNFDMVLCCSILLDWLVCKNLSWLLEFALLWFIAEIWTGEHLQRKPWCFRTLLVCDNIVSVEKNHPRCNTAYFDIAIAFGQKDVRKSNWKTSIANFRPMLAAIFFVSVASVTCSRPSCLDYRSKCSGTYLTTNCKTFLWIFWDRAMDW